MENVNLPNFRHIAGTRIYRASRPDNLEKDSLNAFLTLGIRSIIDLRSMREFPSASGPKHVDNYYQAIDVSIDNLGCAMMRKLTKSENRIVTEMDIKSPKNVVIKDVRDIKVLTDIYELQAHQKGYHFVLDMVSREYGVAVMSRIPAITRIFLYGLYYIDAIFGTHWFMKGLVRHAINTRGILGQYKDIVDHCGPKICIVMQLLCSSDHSPALINCTYGKDRTGIILGLTLSVLGWTPENIAEDYAKSGPELEKSLFSVSGYLQQLNFNKSFYTSEYSTMIDLLNYIKDKYISVPNYLSQIGFGPHWQTKLRSALVDPSYNVPTL